MTTALALFVVVVDVAPMRDTNPAGCDKKTASKKKAKTRPKKDRFRRRRLSKTSTTKNKEGPTLGTRPQHPTAAPPRQHPTATQFCFFSKKNRRKKTRVSVPRTETRGENHRQSHAHHGFAAIKKCVKTRETTSNNQKKICLTWVAATIFDRRV